MNAGMGIKERERALLFSNVPCTRDDTTFPHRATAYLNTRVQFYFFFAYSVFFPLHRCCLHLAVIRTCVSASRSPPPPIYSFTDAWVTAAFCMEPPLVNRSHFYTRLTPSLQCFVCILNRSGGFLYPNPSPPRLFRQVGGKRWKGTFSRLRSGADADLCLCAQRQRIEGLHTNCANKCTRIVSENLPG